MGPVHSTVDGSPTTAANTAIGVAHRLLSRPKVKEAISAGLGSLAAGLVDFILLVVLVRRGVAVPVAAFIAASFGAAVNFAWSKYLAFRDRTPLAFGQALRFAGVALAGALFIALTIQLFAVGLGVSYVLAKLLSSTVVFAAWTYPAQRYLVFRTPLPSADRPYLGLARDLVNDEAVALIGLAEDDAPAAFSMTSAA
jgi:putative flippase GtrA